MMTSNKALETLLKGSRVIIAIIALAIGAAAGWFAAGVGRAVAPRPPQFVAATASRAVSMKPSSAVKPKRKARAKPVPEVSATKAAKSKPVRPEAVQSATTGDSAETPKADGADAEKKAKEDNPFHRYLDMFRNDPAAFAAEFEKEAEADRASLRQLREEIIAKLKMNEEQAAFFEKTLDNLCDEITQQNRERVELITSGRLNDETAADGSIWDGNRILQYKMAADRQVLICNTAEKLYEQLELDGVSETDKQEFLFWAARRTSFSYDCWEPFVQVYDKVYKSMGIGNGIFSWCTRQRQSQKK